MTSGSRLRLVLVLGLVTLLAACSLQPDSPAPPAVPVTVVLPGGEDLGPLPEYHLHLALDATGRRLVGRQQVVVPNRSGVELDEIVFRLYPNLPRYGGRLGVGPVWVDGERMASTLRQENTSLVVPLSRPLQPEARLTISLTFDVEIPQRETGDVLLGLSQGMWSLPDAYPLLAVHDGQRWHQEIAPAHGDPVFAEAALYEVTLTLPATLTVAATGSVLTTTQPAAGRKSYHIVAGPLREFAWLASAEYQVAESVAQGVTVRSYYLPGDGASGQAALNTAAAALRAYAVAFGPYPFPQMTVVEAPLGFYGMEYPGLSLIGLDLYRDLRAELEIRVAHEIAHQWWYAQVGNDPIQTPWLDEGLAEYSTAVYYRQVYGQGRANTLVNQRWLVPYQALVEDGGDAVVNQPAAAFGPEYEVIVYGKAALFFEALNQVLGQETFARVLHEYVRRYRWQIATPEGFLDVAESVSGRDLDSLYNRWILGRQ